MPEAMSSGIPIHYRVEGAGDPLVLHHGFMDSSETWVELGYVEPLARSRQVILMDGRGHGESGKPNWNTAKSDWPGGIGWIGETK